MISTMNRVLIIGASGMLGSMVTHYLSMNPKIELFSTLRRPIKETKWYMSKSFELDLNHDPINKLSHILQMSSPDYIINCVGIIKPFCRDDNMLGVYNAININARFPHELAHCLALEKGSTKVIQIATDCVFDGKEGNYNETSLHNAVDVYGKTKSLGEVVDDNFLNLRCSIVGPELNGNISLLNWFLSQKDFSTVEGYNHHKWNGVTTLQFAEFCEKIIIDNSFIHLRDLNHILHYVLNETVTKYQLLSIFNEVFDRKINIKKVNSGNESCDRTLSSIYLDTIQSSMVNAFKALKDFMNEEKVYNV